MLNSTGFDFMLSGRYRLLSPLGAGGMASVFAARDERLGRQVAVKVLSGALMIDPHFVARFQHEAEAAAKLSHPNIVSVYDVGRDGDRHYIVMELILGRNLKDIIDERGALPLAQAVHVESQLLDGLAYAHEHGLVHRDIKPHNILVTKNGDAKLADFGIAKAVDSSSATQTAVVLGSAHYLSPEQARGEDATAQSDIYSAGVVLYEMCTGVVPFDGTNLLSVATAHINEQPRLPSMLNPQLPATLNRVILHAMAKEASDRVTTAAQMKEELLSVTPDTAEVVEPFDPGRTEVALAPVRVPQTTSDALVIRPALFGFVFWALVTAIAALCVNISPHWLPNSVKDHLAFNALPIASAVLGGSAIVILLIGVLERWRHKYRIDDRAITVERGLISHHRDAIPLPAIINIQLHQSPLARMFHTGTIVLTTGQIPVRGPVVLRLRDIAHVSQIYDRVLDRIGGPHARYTTQHGGEELNSSVM